MLKLATQPRKSKILMIYIQDINVQSRIKISCCAYLSTIRPAKDEMFGVSVRKRERERKAGYITQQYP